MRTAGMKLKGKLTLEINQEISPAQFASLFGVANPEKDREPKELEEDMKECPFAAFSQLPFSRLPPQEKEFVDERFVHQPQSGAIPEVLLRFAGKRFSNPNVYPVSGGMYSYGEPGATWNG
jgi:hypothetical protein